MLVATALVHPGVEPGESRAILFVNFAVRIGRFLEQLVGFVGIAGNRIGHFLLDRGGQQLRLQVIAAFLVPSLNLGRFRLGVVHLLARRQLPLELLGGLFKNLVRFLVHPARLFEQLALSPARPRRLGLIDQHAGPFLKQIAKLALCRLGQWVLRPALQEFLQRLLRLVQLLAAATRVALLAGAFNQRHPTLVQQHFLQFDRNHVAVGQPIKILQGHAVVAVGAEFIEELTGRFNR